MKKNMGKTDRIIRTIVGIILIALGLFLNIGSVLPWVLIVVGAVLLVTGILGFCPIYALLKFNTVKK